MTVYVSGGSKSGKSSLAESLVLRMPAPHYYVATMVPHDAEDYARIQRHRNQRAGRGFKTIECGIHIMDALKDADTRGAFLIDSVTALLANAMFDEKGFHPEAAEGIIESLLAFIEAAPNTVIVGDDIFQDSGLYDDYTQSYRRGLGRIGIELAKRCNRVIEVTTGFAIDYKGEFVWTR